MTKIRNVLITVPHAACDPVENDQADTGGHPCDLLAHHFARLLEHKFRLSNDIRSILIVGDIARARCDLTRKTCSSTTFAHDAVRALESDAVDLYLEVHSFPVKQKEWRLWQVVEIVDAGQTSGARNFFATVGARIEQAGIHAALLTGKNNFLQQTASSHNIPAVMLEVREDLSQNQMLEIASIIVASCCAAM